MSIDAENWWDSIERTESDGESEISTAGCGNDILAKLASSASVAHTGMIRASASIPAEHPVLHASVDAAHSFSVTRERDQRVQHDLNADAYVRRVGRNKQV